MLGCYRWAERWKDISRCCVLKFAGGLLMVGVGLGWCVLRVRVGESDVERVGFLAVCAGDGKFGLRC